MEILKISAGVLALFLAWVLFFKTPLIFKFNAWMRDNVFSDNLVLFSGQRVAILLLILGAISLFSGIERITKDETLKTKTAAKILSRAQDDFRDERYEEAIKKVNILIRSNPENGRAKELLAASHFAMGDKEMANKIIEELIRENPTYPIQSGPLRKIYKKTKKGNKK